MAASAGPLVVGKHGRGGEQVTGLDGLHGPVANLPFPLFRRHRMRSDTRNPVTELRRSSARRERLHVRDSGVMMTQIDYDVEQYQHYACGRSAF